MANGLKVINARIVFTMFSDEQVTKINIDSKATGSNQVGETINVPLNGYVYLNTGSLSDIRWATFTNEGSGSVAVRISGSTDLTYLHNAGDTSFISMQSGSIPKLIALGYVSASYLTYKLQES